MTFKDWNHYFEQNRSHFDWFGQPQLAKFSRSEINLLTKSLQTFQKGENSEGKNLIKYAKAYGDEDYLETIKIFIREEQTHALVLGKLMTFNDISKIKDHWTDTIFRGLRNVAGLEMSVTVLLTAEIIAAIFYKALHNSSNNEALKSCCKQILIDEEMHINFQCFTLRTFNSNRSMMNRGLLRMFHRILMEGTLLVVFADHRSVLRAGGYNMMKWRKEVLAEFNRCSRMIAGDSIHLRENMTIELPKNRKAVVL